MKYVKHFKTFWPLNISIEGFEAFLCQSCTRIIRLVTTYRLLQTTSIGYYGLQGVCSSSLLKDEKMKGKAIQYKEEKVFRWHDTEEEGNAQGSGYVWSKMTFSVRLDMVALTRREKGQEQWRNERTTGPQGRITQNPNHLSRNDLWQGLQGRRLEPIYNAVRLHMPGLEIASRGLCAKETEGTWADPAAAPAARPSRSSRSSRSPTQPQLPQPDPAAAPAARPSRSSRSPTQPQLPQPDPAAAPAAPAARPSRSSRSPTQPQLPQPDPAAAPAARPSRSSRSPTQPQLPQPDPAAAPAARPSRSSRSPTQPQLPQPGGPRGRGGNGTDGVPGEECSDRLLLAVHVTETSV